MQENSDTNLQAFSQDEPVLSSMNHASISPSKAAHPSQLACHASQHCEESTLRLGPAAIQLLLLVILLYAAHMQYPQLHPGFLVACASAFILLLVRNSWVSGISCQTCNFLCTCPIHHFALVLKQAAARQKGNRAPTANQPTEPTQQQARHHTSQPRTPNLTGVWIKVTS